MLKYDAVVFDLDGTLTESSEGIIACVCYALNKMKLPIPDMEDLYQFIGPPLFASFKRYCGMTDEEALQAITLYRERYCTIGFRENHVFPGIRSLLQALKAEGAAIYVATGKLQHISEKVLSYFGLNQYLDGIAGPDEGDHQADKKELIARVLKDARYHRAVMIGDRRSDIIGGLENGMDGIGIMYAPNSRDNEFEGLSCPVAQTTAALSELLLGYVPSSKGYFISIEGLDGCGKTTQADMLERTLYDFGFDVVRTREPGGCRISEKIREILLDVDNSEMHDVTEALLYAAARAQHVREVILPAVNLGSVVLCDRFVDSSVAFQGGGRELGVELIQQINAPAVNICKPDTTLLLRIDHKTALMRRGKASVLDRIEREAEAFHMRVEAAYDVLLKQNPDRFVAVNAAQSPDIVSADIQSAVIHRMKTAGVI